MKIERVGQVATAEIPEIREANIIRVRPGDILAVTCDPNAIDVNLVQEVFAGLLPEGVEVVIGAGMRFDVIRPTKDAE